MYPAAELDVPKSIPNVDETAAIKHLVQSFEHWPINRVAQGHNGPAVWFNPILLRPLFIRAAILWCN